MEKNKKVREFPTQYSESVEKGSFEYNNKASLTEPDNAMSIPEIIARFTRGYGIPVPQHEWTSGSASEEGREFEDNERFFEDFAGPKAADPAPDQGAGTAANEAGKPASADPEKPSEGEDPRA